MIGDYIFNVGTVKRNYNKYKTYVSMYQLINKIDQMYQYKYKTCLRFGFSFPNNALSVSVKGNINNTFKHRTHKSN